MGFKEIIQKIRERKEEKKAMIRQMDNQLRAEEILSERRLSANERELRRYMKEDREASIKVELDKIRKLRQDEINFGHNPLDAPNITNYSDFDVLRQKNLFSDNKNIFTKQSFIHKNNPKLLKSSMRLMR